jgi:hypothetical protein
MDDKTAFEERILPAIRNMGERFADVIARENKRQAAEETSFSQAMRAYFSDPAHKGFRNEFKQDLMGQGLMQRQDAMLERKEAVNALNDAYDIFTRCKWEFQSGNAESHDMPMILLGESFRKAANEISAYFKAFPPAAAEDRTVQAVLTEAVGVFSRMKTNPYVQETVRQEQKANREAYPPFSDRIKEAGHAVGELSGLPRLWAKMSSRNNGKAHER